GKGAGQSIAARRFIANVNRHTKPLAALDQEALHDQVLELRRDLRGQGLKDPLVAKSFAVIREIAGRALGTRHYDTQLLGGWLLLRGMVAEMPTGEGKTLTATLACGTAAMAGLPVHVLSVNDYLTARDAQWMGPIYEGLGLSLGVVLHETANEDRHEAYAMDITYCTSKEIVFDFLRDRIVLGRRRHSLRHQVEPIYGNSGCHRRLLLRGLHFAIVDEADSVLIDEARTPLIISGAGGGKYERHFLEQALEVATRLKDGSDYTTVQAEHRIKLTPDGEERIKELSEYLGPLWSGRIRRAEVVSQALSAQHLFNRDEHYLLRDGKVEIIDPLTGRVAEGRSWERGLHQLIELKEGCEPSQQNSTLARISYQSFFQRYLHLSGMTGTASEVSGELWRVYGLAVATVPPNRPCVRKSLRPQVYTDAEKKWQAISERIRELEAQGRAVLVATASVAASEQAGEVFREAGIDFRVLNAKQDQEEAEIIAMAGQRGQITVATSMAGRGTDIGLEESVRKSGGLHVILSEHFDAARVDRQLAGRCARQGDPGSFETILSLEDKLFTTSGAKLIAKTAAVFGPEQGRGYLLALMALRWEQKRRERKSYRDRLATQKYDRQQGDLLSISGTSE
ncbi:MAG: hypothetical protein DRQ37_05870, partial [Gammaproteobacteria bacterium]